MRAIDANTVVDRLYMPGKRLDSTLLLHENLEQSVFNATRILDSIRSDKDARAVALRLLDEIGLYTFALGELISVAEDEVSSFYKDASVESDAAVDRRDKEKATA